MEDRELLVLDLEPIPITGLRAPETAIRETALGKRNRISIGQPFVRRVDRPVQGDILQPEDLERFDPEGHEFFELELSFTLLPDDGCRFSSADLFVEVGPPDGNLPLILRLMPEREATQRIVEARSERSSKAEAKVPVPKVLNAAISNSYVQREDSNWKTLSVHLEGFGERTREAGWRVRVSESREVPLNIRGLHLLCARRADAELTAEIKVTAEIEIRAHLDRWVTSTFRRRKDPDVAARLTIP